MLACFVSCGLRRVKTPIVILDLDPTPLPFSSQQQRKFSSQMCGVTICHDSPYLPHESEVINTASFANGNVRQALLDAKGLVQRGLHPLTA